MKYNKHHKNVSAFVIAIRNHVIDFARKCINILRWLPMCAHQLAWMLGVLINFDTLILALHAVSFPRNWIIFQCHSF